jgi:hypothetical protein
MLEGDALLVVTIYIKKCCFSKNTQPQLHERMKCMSIEDIIHAWKADEDTLNGNEFISPIGEGLTEQELLEVSGGKPGWCALTVCFWDTIEGFGFGF